MRLTSALYTLLVGLWLGFFGMMIICVTAVFKQADAIQASPNVTPWNDPSFAQYASKAVAGNQANAIFAIGWPMLSIISAALLLLGIWHTMRAPRPLPRRWIHMLHMVSLTIVFGGCVAMAGPVHTQMNELRDTMYNLDNSLTKQTQARIQFDTLHNQSERFAKLILISLALATILRSSTRYPRAFGEPLTPLQ